MDSKETVTVTLPKLGESIHSATIVRWFKKEGERVQLDEPLLEVSTDKVNSEIPSPVAGILQTIYAQASQELNVGEPLALIATATGTTSCAQAAAPKPAPVCSGGGSDFFSPALLRLAKEKGIGMDELSRIPGSGEQGRLTRQDLEGYLAKGDSEAIERLKMSGMRKAIAENMVKSFYEAPHATLVTEVDVTNILKHIQQTKEAFLAEHGVKLTITSFIAQALTRALQAYPLLNASLEGDTILVKKHVHLGIAVSVDQGLLVPVIRHCQQKDIPSFAKAVSALAEKARAGKLSKEDLAEGTITITNFGMSGVQIGIPIIRYPEVAIVGIGAICKRVVPLEDDVLAVRSMVHLSVTFDHRVLDGMYGCGFLNELKKHLEKN